MTIQSSKSKNDENNDKMEKFETQFNEATADVQLGTDEKTLMRERLVSYMEHKPLRVPQQNEEKVSFSPFGTFFGAHHLIGALAIALVVTTSTFSVSSAAAEALPGDLLYPVKVHINEGVKTVFMTSDEARITWERERAEKRLEEASVLASQGRLDKKAQKEVAKHFAAHAEAAVETVREVEKNDPALAAEASSELEEALGTHEVVLARLIVGQDDEDEEDGSGLVEQVHAVAAEVGDLREAAEEKLAFVVDEDLVDEPSTGEVVAVDQEDANVVMAEEVVDEETSKQQLDSANMRVRATYRAQARALDQLARAEELVAVLSDDSELRAPARAQITSATKLITDGAVALEDHDLGTAYSSYRNAATKLQKVVQLVEVVDLFDIEIYTSTMPEDMAREEKESTEEGVTDVKSEEDIEVFLSAKGDTTAANTESMRKAAQQTVRKARTLLLTIEGYDEDTVDRANSFIKDAAAYIMRGDIYLVLEESVDALDLFQSAHTSAEHAVELLQNASDNSGVTEVEPVVEEINLNFERDVDVVDLTLEMIEVTHSFTEGEHAYRGAIATSCATVSATLAVAESLPEQITLVLTASPVEEACDELRSVIPFTATTTASEAATLVEISLNDEMVEWVLVEETTTMGLEDAAQPSLFRRALSGAQGMLGVE